MIITMTSLTSERPQAIHHPPPADMESGFCTSRMVPGGWHFDSKGKCHFEFPPIFFVVFAHRMMDFLLDKHIKNRGGIPSCFSVAFGNFPF